MDRDIFVPLLATFVSFFEYKLVTIHDTEFYGDSKSSDNWMPFTLDQLVPMSLTLRDVTLGLVELAFPESRHQLSEGYKMALRNPQDVVMDKSYDTAVWSHLFNKTVKLLRQFHARDTRRQFCPGNFWPFVNFLMRSYITGISSRWPLDPRQDTPPS